MKAHVSKTLDAALAYAARGWPVFPCRPKNKRPWTKNGFKDATTDTDQIRRWWEQWPDAMIGMPTGEISGVDVVDLDRKPDHDDGVATWEKLESENGPVDTRTHGTPSTGQHKFFQHQNDLRSIGLDRLALGLEVKADGGYVIMPSSRMANGKGYTVINDIEPAPMPPWLQEMIRRLKDFDEQIGQDARAAAASANETRPDLELIKAALNAIPSDAYDDWYRIAGALRRELGDAGYA
jgi:putative DNA primase/helicase